MKLLSELELAVAVNACRNAGAENAAIALSRHITLLQIEIEKLKLKIADHADKEVE